MKTISAILAILTVTISGALAQSGDPLPNWAGGILVTGTTPNNGTSEVQTVTLTAFAATKLSLSTMGNTASLTFTGSESNSTINTEVQAALAALPVFSGTAQVSVSTSGSTNRVIQLTYAGNLATLNVPQIAATVTGTVVTVSGTTTTPGVTADGRRSAKGTLCINLGAGTLYQNTGSFPSPNWVKVSSE